MADLISKNELYKKGESLLNSFINGKKNGEQAFRDLFSAIADMPTVEQKHGHWIIEDEDYNAYKCSNCGEVWCINDGTPEENGMDYCQHCGAEMDEVTEDDG